MPPLAAIRSHPVCATMNYGPLIVLLAVVLCASPALAHFDPCEPDTERLCPHAHKAWLAAAQSQPGDSPSKLMENVDAELFLELKAKQCVMKFESELSEECATHIEQSWPVKCQSSFDVVCKDVRA